VGWLPDPSSKAQKRFWDNGWTDRLLDGETESKDPAESYVPCAFCAEPVIRWAFLCSCCHGVQPAVPGTQVVFYSGLWFIGKVAHSFMVFWASSGFPVSGKVHPDYPRAAWEYDRLVRESQTHPPSAARARQETTPPLPTSPTPPSPQ
jgi:hypothetical protein